MISVNNGVTNIFNTPGVITDIIANRPNATIVADGTLYYSTDTLEIYQSISGSWIKYTGGGGGGGLTGAGVPTRVAFWDTTSSLSSNSQLYWDNINNRLGVGGSPFGYKLSVLDANYYARFGVTAGSDANAITFGKSTSSGIGFFGPASERKLLIGDGATGVAAFTTYNSNVIQFGYSSVLGGSILPSSLTLFTGNFFYSTGTNTHNQIELKPSIQTTGGTNLLRGIYYNPNKTTTVGTTNYFIESTQGNVLMRSGVQYGTEYYGLSMNESTYEYWLGALQHNLGGVDPYLYINVDPTKNIESKFVANNTGIWLEKWSGLTKLGDVQGQGLNTLLQINDSSAVINTTINGIVDGINLDLSAIEFKFGDFSNNNYLYINDGIPGVIHLNVQNRFTTMYGGAETGIEINFLSLLYSFGNYNGNNFIQIDDSAGTTQISANNQVNLFTQGNGTQFGLDDATTSLVASTTLIVTGGSHPTTNDHLKITIGGTNYVIQLLRA